MRVIRGLLARPTPPLDRVVDIDKAVLQAQVCRQVIPQGLHTIALGRMMTRGEVLEAIDYDRPKSRTECKEGPRPCMYVSCKHNLYLDVNMVTGSIKFNFPDKDIFELKETCALDVAERGGITLEEVGEIMNLTRERVRQVETAGLARLQDFRDVDRLKDYVT